MNNMYALLMVAMNGHVISWLHEAGITNKDGEVRLYPLPIMSLAQLIESGIVAHDCCAPLDGSMATQAERLWSTLASHRTVARCTVDDHDNPTDASALEAEQAPGPRQHRSQQRRIRCEDFTSDSRTAAPSLQSVTLVIDSRERNSSLCEMTIPQITCTLPVGDFAMTCANRGGAPTMLPVLLERKAESDLAASVLDNRYRAQKANMRQLAARGFDCPFTLIYLVEADRSALPLAAMRQRVQSATTSTGLRDGFTVISAGSPTQSIYWLHGLTAAATRLSRINDGPTLDGWIEETRDRINYRNAATMLPRMLRIVKGVSHDVAVRVASKFRTVLELHDHLAMTAAADDVRADVEIAKLGEKSGVVVEKASMTVRRVFTEPRY
jgi:ERCC4-type nuclease